MLVLNKQFAFVFDNCDIVLLFVRTNLKYAESYSDSADHRRSKFGGRDFRSGNNSNGSSDDYYSATNSYGNSDYGASGGYGNNNTSYGTSDYGASGGYGNNVSYGTSDYGAPAGGYGNDASYGNTDYGTTSDSYDYSAPPPAACDFSGSYGSADGYELSPSSLEVGSECLIWAATRFVIWFRSSTFLLTS